MLSTGCTQDISLVREAQGGNRAAFDQLVRNHDEAVLRLVLRITGAQSEAQDISQEAFLRIYKSLGGFRFDSSFSTWIYRIVSNVCLDYLRRNLRRKERSAVRVNVNDEERDLLDQVSDERPANNPERLLLSRELRAKISRALQELTPRQRTVFKLRHFQGLKLQAIGEILNTSEASIKNTLFRATHRLRFQLEPYSKEIRGPL
jgi:RNA polymerase sigma-70 factor (ECF subfamily)